MRWLSWRRGVLLLLLVATLAPLGMHTGQAVAATNQGPDPANFVGSSRYGNSYPGVARTVDYVVATSAFNTILQTTIKVYLPASSGQIVIHNQNICYNTFRNGGRNYDQLDDGVISSSGHAVVFALVGTTQFQWGDFDSSGTCDSKTVTLNLSGVALDPATNLYPYSILVTANAAADKYMNTFWLTGPAGTIISQDSSLPSSSFGMNQTSPIPTGNNPSNTQSPPNPYVNYTNWTIPFGPDCSVNTPTVTKRIEMFDDDNRGNWDVQPRPFYIKLTELNRSDVVQGTLTPTFTFPDASGGFTALGGGLYEVWTTASGKRIWIDYTFRRDMKYQWFVDSVYYDNTLQFKIPFDNVFYYLQCQSSGFDLHPTIGLSVTGAGGPISGNVAEAGDSVTFSYAVNNSGSTGSGATTCNIYANNHTGYFSVPGTAETTGSAPPGAPSCPATFPVGNTPLGNETVNNLPANTSVCRSLYVNPATPGGPPLGTEVCVYVTNKPYARAYGGDASAGGGLVTTPGVPNSCALNSGAAVIGWNKRSAGGYGGAGVQFAAYAMSTIFDTATSIGNGAGAAPVGAGLSFANNATDLPNGVFGGNFGSAACMQDYYATKPSATSALPASIGAGLISGAYVATGNITLGGGTINPGTKVSIYIDGNLFISSNITYGGGGSWTSGNIPMLRLIVRGDIFVGSNVSQLDGLYAAQPNGASGGTIHTCALSSPSPPATPFTPIALDGSLRSSCDDAKLTVNGALVAKQVRLLRVIGTLRQSNASEASTSGNIAEVVNYGPALWMSQPPLTPGVADYDAITSLPPIL